jgi:peroxiredoxin Q/BCP
VQVTAILTQDPEAVRRYIEETGLAFDVLIDSSREVVRAYGVWHRLGLDAWNIARPAAFLIEPDRTLRYSFIGDRQTEFPTQAEILAALDA